jgi:ribonuclease HI
MPFYAVHTGINKGIYSTWIECEKQIVGFKGAKFKKFNTKQEAENFVNDIVPVPINNILNEINPSTTIYGDGGYNNTTKPDAWGSVVNGYGNDLIGYYSHLLSDMSLKEVVLPRGIGKRTIIVANFSGVEQQNNGAELMAAVAALRISIDLISNGIPVKTVYCDSQVILYWSIRLKPESEVSFDPRKVTYIKELIQLRKYCEAVGCNFLKISGNFGLNKADLGFHRD